MQLTRDSATIAGEADQAAALLKILDSSHQFKNSAFTLPIARGVGGDIFNIRSARQGVTP